ncbi:ABC transporter ATP-binding protein [Treponema ruminis]|uniref:ATP-binding cassette subfamily B protein n=1 Tax=Treponema ruminis TaxID=744515 RepID=A0A7W8G7N9_9SPIR|nr:ABC transporter ATP-binding protein [Treponema ruminis]MBB5225398.1 ATP-binding cassette subfamily B protein [Treponema ruminis]QSI01731.1 ABC transporter ATP-binding protein [Treponema ruminis]
MFEILQRFFNFCDKENRRKFHLAMIIGVVNSFFMALRIAAVAVMISGIIRSLKDGVPFTANTIWLSLGIMSFSLLGAIITKKNMSMWQTEGGYRTAANKRIEIAEHLRYIPMGYFNENSLGQITSVTTNTMELLGDVATRAVMLVMQGLLDSALIIAMIFFFDWRIALIALAGFALFQFVNIFMRLSVRSISVQKDKADTAQVSKILEYIQGIAEVRAYNITGPRRTELNAIIDHCKRTFIKMELHCIPFACIQSIIAKLAGVAIMIASIFFYLNGTMLLSNCAVMLICSFMLFGAMESGGNYSALLRVIDIAVKKAEAILNVPMMSIDGSERPVEQAKTVQWTVFSESPSSYAAKAEVSKETESVLNLSASNISFAYDKKKIIDGVSLTIPEKSTTAIVGPSGGGKTTLCHLLARFWDVDSGEVTLAGKNIRDYDMDNLMVNFSFVFQNVYLFHDTIANNIRFGEPDAPMEKVIEAAKKACCHEFISALPNGYDTVIGEGGASLSGGEKQRISIARAIMKDAPIIILDEATANVDPENERDLMEAVRELTREKTVIMIAHRLKTVRNADQIIVIDKGKIAEQGKHDELIKMNGIYARFIDSRKKAVSWKL